MIQLIKSDVITQITNTTAVTGSQYSCQPAAFQASPPDPNPELDIGYPMTGNSASDSPFTDLAPFVGTVIGEAGRKFSAIMYLMWTPNADSACNTGTCKIPVPLGNVSWWWSGDAINSLVPQSNGTNWILSCGSNAQPQNITFQSSNPAQPPNYSYPVWQHTDNEKDFSCQ